jgi:hypothetical protein
MSCQGNFLRAMKMKVKKTDDKCPPAMLWHIVLTQEEGSSRDALALVLTQEVMKNNDSKEVNSDDNKLQEKQK